MKKKPKQCENCIYLNFCLKNGCTKEKLCKKKKIKSEYDIRS